MNGGAERPAVSADALLLFGPGEAKLQLKERLGRSKVLSQSIGAVERTDKLTDRQIVAKAKEPLRGRVHPSPARSAPGKDAPLDPLPAQRCRASCENRTPALSD